METFFDTTWWLIIEAILYLALALFAIATAVIPTFFNEKMMKPNRNYVSGISLRKRLGYLDKYGRYFIASFCASGILGFSITKLEGCESDYKSKINLKEQLAIRATADSIANSLRDSLYYERSKGLVNESQKQVRDVQDTVRSVKSILNAKNFQYEALSSELRLANTQKLELEKELNSPILQECENPYGGNSPELKYDSIKKRYIFNAYYTNLGHGKAEVPRERYYFFDIKTLKLIDSTTGAYEDTTSVISQDQTVFYGFFKTNNCKREYALLEVTYQSHFGKKYSYVKVYTFDTSYVDKVIPITNRFESEKVNQAFYTQVKKK